MKCYYLTFKCDEIYVETTIEKKGKLTNTDIESSRQEISDDFHLDISKLVLINSIQTILEV